MQARNISSSISWKHKEGNRRGVKIGKKFGVGGVCFLFCVFKENNKNKMNHSIILTIDLQKLKLIIFLYIKKRTVEYCNIQYTIRAYLLYQSCLLFKMPEKALIWK